MGDVINRAPNEGTQIGTLNGTLNLGGPDGKYGVRYDANRPFDHPVCRVVVIFALLLWLICLLQWSSEACSAYSKAMEPFMSSTGPATTSDFAKITDIALGFFFKGIWYAVPIVACLGWGVANVLHIAEGFTVKAVEFYGSPGTSRQDKQIMTTGGLSSVALVLYVISLNTFVKGAALYAIPICFGLWIAILFRSFWWFREPRRPERVCPILRSIRRA